MRCWSEGYLHLWYFFPIDLSSEFLCLDFQDCRLPRHHRMVHLHPFQRFLTSGSWSCKKRSVPLKAQTNSYSSKPNCLPFFLRITSRFFFIYSTWKFSELQLVLSSHKNFPVWPSCLGACCSRATWWRSWWQTTLPVLCWALQYPAFQSQPL